MMCLKKIQTSCQTAISASGITSLQHGQKKGIQHSICYFIFENVKVKEPLKGHSLGFKVSLIQYL